MLKFNLPPRSPVELKFYHPQSNNKNGNTKKNCRIHIKHKSIKAQENEATTTTTHCSYKNSLTNIDIYLLFIFLSISLIIHTNTHNKITELCIVCLLYIFETN